MEWIDGIIYFCLGAGVLFNFLGSLGLLRFPDVYTRLHAGTKCTTFGFIFIVLAIIIYGLWKYNEGDTSMLTLSLHAFIALLAIILTNPAGAHALARATHRSGIKPVRAVVDDLEEEKK
jgi:multicomponent Na+:H+ antiporter subunit G